MGPSHDQQQHRYFKASCAHLQGGKVRIAHANGHYKQREVCDVVQSSPKAVYIPRRPSQDQQQDAVLLLEALRGVGRRHAVHAGQQRAEPAHMLVMSSALGPVVACS